jgi:hypothetical protein
MRRKEAEPMKGTEKETSALAWNDKSDTNLQCPKPIADNERRANSIALESLG